MIDLHHGRVRLALHEHKPGDGVALLLLHELGASSSRWPEVFVSWKGPVFALDFAGHGRSAPVKGGAYTPELLAGDADLALERIGTAAVVGAGLGAYVSLLLAGARPDLVPAAMLLPGRGLAGGGCIPRATTSKLHFLSTGEDLGRLAGDSMLSLLEHDIRPVGYARTFALSARCLLMVDSDDIVAPWWRAVGSVDSARKVTTDLGAALKEMAVAAG